MPFGLTSVITYALSVVAIVITSVVLIQGYRDTSPSTPSSTKSSYPCVRPETTRRRVRSCQYVWVGWRAGRGSKGGFYPTGMNGKIKIPTGAARPSAGDRAANTARFPITPSDQRLMGDRTSGGVPAGSEVLCRNRL